MPNQESKKPGRRKIPQKSYRGDPGSKVLRHHATRLLVLRHLNGRDPSKPNPHIQTDLALKQRGTIPQETNDPEPELTPKTCRGWAAWVSGVAWKPKRGDDPGRSPFINST